MNKYLRGTINILVGLAIGFVGLLFALNIQVGGYLFFPDIVMRVDSIIVPSLPAWWIGFVPGTIPLFFLITTLGFSIFIMFGVIKFIKKFDIEKIANEVLKKDKRG